MAWYKDCAATVHQLQKSQPLQEGVMKKSTKAALFSAIILPSAGHFYLKRYLRGVMLAVPFLIASTYLLNLAVERASEIIEKVMSGQIPYDPEAISALISAQSAQSADSGTHSSQIATWTLIVCWVIGVIDSYRLGSLQEKIDSEK
jgi:hypothetical protein